MMRYDRKLARSMQDFDTDLLRFHARNVVRRRSCGAAVRRMKQQHFAEGPVYAQTPKEATISTFFCRPVLARIAQYCPVWQPNGNFGNANGRLLRQGRQSELSVRTARRSLALRLGELRSVLRPLMMTGVIVRRRQSSKILSDCFHAAVREGARRC